MFTTHNRRGTQRGQACAGKARHHDEVARLGHVTARGLGRSRRGRGGHRFGVIMLLDLVIGISLTAVLALLLSVLGLALALVLLLFGLVALLLRLEPYQIRSSRKPRPWSRPLRPRSFPWKPDQSCPCSGSSRY